MVKEDDVNVHIPFQCKIGGVKATLGILIEPDPHSDGKGTHAHFHTTIICPKIKIVDYPEPDRCQITDETCPFWEPMGGYKRDPSSRKWLYAHHLIHSIASIEHTGTQLVNMIFEKEGLSLKNELRLIELNRLLLVSKLIDKRVYKQLEELRKVRNKLAHKPNAYLEFEEKKLFKLIEKANNTFSILSSTSSSGSTSMCRTSLTP
jgi:uncharacterized protein YutE (UPF0331/DUF86 family)